MGSQGFANEPVSVHRIHSLLPKGIQLNIEPNIPSDFILVTPRNEEYFWMPDGFFEKYMADSKSAHRPFIHLIVRGVSTENKGKSPIKECVAEMKKHFPIRSTSLRWGNYDVISIKMNATDDDEYMAFVDLNRDDGGFVIFHLGYYKKIDHGNGNQPSKEDLAFWNDFLNKTKAF